MILFLQQIFDISVEVVGSAVILFALITFLESTTNRSRGLFFFVGVYSVFEGT